jgi:polyferredoxin
MKWITTLVRVLFLALFLFLTFTGNMMLWLGLFGVSLIVAIFFGRLYCGYVCPMNTVVILIAWLSKKLKLQTENTPNWLKKGILPWVALGISVIVMVLSKKTLNINLPILLVWLAISILITLRYKPEVFHNYICPFGALQKLFGRFAFFSKRVSEDVCIGCKKCEKVCPSLAIAVKGESNKAEISTKLCFQCTNCSEICPVSAISYKGTKAGY